LNQTEKHLIFSSKKSDAFSCVSYSLLIQMVETLSSHSNAPGTIIDVHAEKTVADENNCFSAWYPDRFT